MRSSGRLATLALAVTLLALPGCGRKGPAGPARDVVTPLLRQEAEALKRENEKLDPILRVKATWNIEGIDVTERPQDADRPWAGTIRFKIKSETRDVDGTVAADEFDRHFDYVYMASLQRWVFQLSPSPAP